MNERVVEIIAYIVNEMNAGSFESDEAYELKNLSQKLVDSGYTENEISFAFSWILEKGKMNQSPKTRFSLKQSHRILHDFEKVSITPEAYGYLIQLCEFDLIDQMEMEQIIEKAVLSSSSPVSISEMKDIVSTTIFKPEEEMESSFFLLEKTYNVH